MTEVKHLTGEDDVGHVVPSLPAAAAAAAIVLVVKELLVLQVQGGLVVGGKLVFVSDASLVVCHELKHSGELEQAGDITPRVARQRDDVLPAARVFPPAADSGKVRPAGS